MGVGPRPPADRTMSSQVPVCAGCGDVGCRTLGGSMYLHRSARRPTPRTPLQGGPVGRKDASTRTSWDIPRSPEQHVSRATRLLGASLRAPKPGEGVWDRTQEQRSAGHSPARASLRPSNYRQNCPEQPFPTPDRGKQEREESDCCCL